MLETQGLTRREPDVIVRLILKIIQCPRVSCSLPTLSREERRNSRVRPPLPAHGCVVYRSDGELLKGGAAMVATAGWGAARWSSDGVLAEGARGRLAAGTTGNAAKYYALATAFARALERSATDTVVTFELDTNFIARQVQQYGKGKFACRSPVLTPLFLRCTRLGRELEQAGVSWKIRHVYAEYNLVADTLAREGALWGDRGWATF